MVNVKAFEMSDDSNLLPPQLARRTFLGQASLGLGSMALAGLLQPQVLGAATPGGAKGRKQPYRGAIHPLHNAQKAKRVIFLCMAGGPSHLELFDEKPVGRAHEEFGLKTGGYLRIVLEASSVSSGGGLHFSRNMRPRQGESS